MDYLARLIAGANASPNKNKLNTPAERLRITTKICDNLRLLWQKGNVSPEDEAATARTTDLLARLHGILLEESRKVAPYSCFLHIATSQIYIIVTKLALLSQDSAVIHSASQLYHVLINGEAEGLLDNKLFSRSLLDLVRYSVLGPRVFVNEPTEASLIELLFSICTKIRLDPDILPAWFHPERERSQARVLQGDSRRSQFPLFYVLVQYVHHDGPVGDFARTGLLYLTETAAKSKALETWMIESDLAPQMASGLGALYSRLSRHFPPLEETEKALPILAFSDLPEVDRSAHGTRRQFQQNMKEFLAYLAFWQDTLNHCKSAEVSDTLLDHFQVLFVQQLLYPSLLESSDVDGGSTAAVTAHLTRILLAVEHSELSRRMLGYLLASKTDRSLAEGPRKHRQRPSISRRKSLEHLAALAEAAQSPSPDLFNLLDLISLSLQSKHVNTVNGSLKLMTVIISKQHQYATSGLFKLEPVNDGSPGSSVEIFTNMLVEYFDIAASISSSETTMDESYQAALTDVKDRLSRHSCLQIHENDTGVSLNSLKVLSDCKLLGLLLNLLSTFFGNRTLTNLLLTETLLSLASCDRITLHGWLVPTPGATADQGARNVSTVLQSLTRQAKHLRSKYGGWESLITRRRHDLSEDDYMVVSDTRTISNRTKTSGPGGSNRSQDEASQQRSRPGTPVGHPIGSPAFGSIDGALSASPSTRPGLMERSTAGSPLRQSYLSQEAQVSGIGSNSNFPSDAQMNEMLKVQIRLDIDQESEEGFQSLSLLTRRLQAERITSTETSSLAALGETDSGAMTPNTIDIDCTIQRSHASLSHILTNAIILQEFILEVAAVIQVRGTVFGEVDLNQ